VRTVACATLQGRPVALSGGDDRTARIWDLETCLQLAVLSGHSKAINAVTFFTMRDSPMIATGGDDGTVRIWDAAGQHCLSVLVLPYPVFTICETQPLKLVVGAGWELVAYDPATEPILGPQ
jgi:WD40 repeat protein